MRDFSIGKVLFYVLIPVLFLAFPNKVLSLFNGLRHGYYDWKSQDYISRKALKLKIKPGSAITFSELVGGEDGVVCLLFPHDFFVHYENEEVASAINHFLQKNYYVMHENEWGLVYSKDSFVKAARYTRHSDLEVLDLRDDPNKDQYGLPEGFTPVRCALVKEASLYKTKNSAILLGKQEELWEW